VIERARKTNGWKKSGSEVRDTLQIATREGMFRTEVPTRDPRDRLEIKAALKRKQHQSELARDSPLSSFFSSYPTQTDLSRGANRYTKLKVRNFVVIFIHISSDSIFRCKLVTKFYCYLISKCDGNKF